MALAQPALKSVAPSGGSASTRDWSATLKRLEDNLRKVVDDKNALIDVTICALLSGSHVLIEDVPGVGKTTYIKALSKMLGLEMVRVQFTSDLLPSDIVGVEVYDPEKKEFALHRGPVFTQILLADELNRASPRTQSALLEAMGEGHVTIDRRCHELPKPFLVFASQNPMDNIGTYELPESQLDRFAAKIRLGYPSQKREVEIFQAATRDPLAVVEAGVLSVGELLQMQDALDKVHISDQVATYVKRVIDRSRGTDKLRVGVSTRGGVIWLRMARAMAMRAGRDFVTPDDLQALGAPCLSHRIVTASGGASEAVVKELLNSVDVD